MAIGILAGAIAIFNQELTAALVAAGAFTGLGLVKTESLRNKKG